MAQDKFLDMEGATTLYDDMYDKKAPVIHDFAEGEALVLPTMEAPFDSLVIKGKTEQRTTEGKNLYPYVNGVSQLEDFIVYPEGASLELLENGFRVTVGRAVKSSFYIKKLIHFEEGKSYRISFDVDDVNAQAGIFIGGSVYKAWLYYARQFKTYVATETFDGYIFFYDTSEVSGHKTTFTNVQLEEGSTATSYEPYTGGLPSPSPDYPQEIHSAGEKGSIEVKAGGKNLIDFSKMPTAELQSDGSFFIPDMVYSNKIMLDSIVYPPCVLSCEVKSEQGANFRLRCLYTDGTTGDFPSNSNGGWVTWNMHPSKPVEAIGLYSGGGGIRKSGYYRKVQLELGSVATAYEPFKPIQSATATTPNGLNGIVDYTGKVWFKDKKDYATGKQTIETREVILDGSEDEKWKMEENEYRKSFRSVKAYTDLPQDVQRKPFYSSIGNGVRYDYDDSNTCFLVNNQLYFNVDKNDPITVDEWKAMLASNPVKCLVGQSPVITDIPQSEMDAFHALRTNSPTTSLWADSSASLEVGYKADTKGWILEQIQNALGQSTAQTMALTRSLPSATQRGIIDKAITE